MTLKPKSKQVLDIIAAQPKTNATEAYLQVHGTDNRVTAATNAYKLLQKPESQIYLEKHIDRARDTVIQLLNSDKDEIRLRSSQDILDRSHGKATTRIEQQTTGVTLNIDLTSSLE
jgi:hypothetical protein